MYGGLVDLHKGVITPLPAGEGEDVPMSEWIEDQLNFQKQLHDILKQSLMKRDQHNISVRMGEMAEKAGGITEYPANSMVLVSYPRSRFGQGPAKKLQPIRRGPMQVQKGEGSTYQVQNLNHEHQTMKVHVSRLVPFRYDANYTDPKEIALSDDEEFIVERIVRHRVNGDARAKLTSRTRLSELEFEVKWEGYAPEANTWEPWKNLRTVAATHRYLTDIGAETLIPKEFRPQHP
jgi:hypothetical protein